MGRAINLRQLETFKALIELGTVCRAADAVAISQPGASKLLLHFESDTGLHLFDRVKGRLVPTAQALRLYQEIEHIFSGVRQAEKAIETVRREAQGRLNIGVVPALEGAMTQRATMKFLASNPKVYCSIHSAHSKWIAQSILDGKIDVGIVAGRVDNPSLVTEPLEEHPLVCMMPPDHELARLKVVRPEDLDGVPFISFNTDSYASQKIASLFELRSMRANVVMSVTATSTCCQFVAAGLGVSLVHPLFIAGMEDRVVTRPFEPATPYDYLFCYAANARNNSLIKDFVTATKSIAAQISEAVT